MLAVIGPGTIRPAAAATVHSSHNIAYVYDFGSGVNDPNFIGSSVFVNAITGATPGSGNSGTYTGTTLAGTTSYTFTNVPLSTLQANPGTALNGYDTVLLYEACSIGNPANSAAMSAVNSFLQNVGKVIVLDGDRCSPGQGGVPDYSHFAFPFQSNNPGPRGASGSYTSVEASTLTAGLSAGPVPGDAVGDANILTARDPGWFSSISATNTNTTAGPVEAYARTSSGGLAVFEGEDFWYTFGPSGHLKQVFDLLLGQSWNPDDLPSTTPIGDVDPAGVPLGLGHKLAEMYAPTLLFDPSEPDYPMGVDQFLGLPSPPNLAYDESCFPSDAMPVAVNGPMKQAQLLDVAVTRSACEKAIGGNPFVPLISTTPNPEAAQYGGTKPHQTFFLTQVPDNNDRRGLDTSSWITYYHVYPTIDGGLMVQYWHFFAYNNQQSDSFLASGQGNHYGDWDASIQVQLDRTLAVKSVWFSRHNKDHPGDELTTLAPFNAGGKTKPGIVYMSGTHPIVMADSGSHAAFASPADYCNFQDQGPFNYTGKTVWGDPANPGGLKQVHCHDATATLRSTVGGTAWSNVSGGSVVQGGAVDHTVTGTHGGPLRNLGQFNPGTMANCSTCVGIPPPSDVTKPIAQWGTWFPGDAGPFTGYSGLWGSPTDHSPLVYPPRGPVYQGFADGKGFTAWYNMASPGKWTLPPVLSFCGPFTSPCPTGAPSAPQHVVVVAGNGTAAVSWQPPLSGGGSTVLGYTITAAPFYSDRIPSPPSGTVSATVGPTTLSASLTGLVADCHQRYQVFVQARNAAGVGSGASPTTFRPSGVLDPSHSPATVVILLDGINEAQPRFSMNPYQPTLDANPSYCPESWNSSNGIEAEADFAGSPKGPWSFFHKWNFGEVDSDGHGTGNDESAPRALPGNSSFIPAGTYTHTFMLDEIAAEGAVILPFSYRGAQLTSVGGTAKFDFEGYNSCDATPQPFPPDCLGSASIDGWASTLDSEIRSIVNVWPSTHVVVMGHSQGGLIAFTWWHTKTLPPNFIQGFSLDSPINGACAGPVLGNCVGPPSYPKYGDRVNLDPSYLQTDARSSQNFRFIGTFGDSPAGGYGSGAETLEHQLLFDYSVHSASQVESLCANGNSESGCPAPAPPDHISECSLTSGIPSWEKDAGHYVEKFCPGDVAYFDNVLGLHN